MGIKQHLINYFGYNQTCAIDMPNYVGGIFALVDTSRLNSLWKG